MASIGGPGPKVRVWELQDRSNYPGKRWAVRWKVGHKVRTRSFDSKVAASKYRSRLETAVGNGEAFVLGTGLPASWSGSSETVAVWAKRWFDRQTTTWTPRSRRNASDTLVRALCELVRDKAPKLTGKELTKVRAEVRTWLAGPSGTQAPLWLRRWSLPLADINSDVAGRAAANMRKTLTGDPVAVSSQRRIRSTMRAMFNAAVADEVLVAQPWPAGTKARKADRAKSSVDVRRLPNPVQAREIIEGLVNHQPTSRNFRVLSWLVFLGGLRPSEALVLDVGACSLPEEGWGEVQVTRALQDAGALWTDADEEVGSPKVSDRLVPIPPALVAILREHLAGRTTGLVVQTASGRHVSPTNWLRSWRRRRKKLGHEWRVYDLRHACATIWLRAGVPVGQVAERLGHSPETLLRIYAGVLSGDDERANGLIDSVLDALN